MTSRALLAGAVVAFCLGGLAALVDWLDQTSRRLDEMKELETHGAAMTQDALQRLERLERLMEGGTVAPPLPPEPGTN